MRVDFGSRLLLWQSREVAVPAPRRGAETRIPELGQIKMGLVKIGSSQDLGLVKISARDQSCPPRIELPVRF